MASSALAKPVATVSATSAISRTKELTNWLNTHISKGINKVHTERITVTPELAHILLEKNIENRNIRPAKLEQLKSDMREGRFKFNGETLKIAKSGELNDGQHRLQAIIETHKPQDMLLVFGVERDSRYTVDTGAARSTNDHLALQGWPYATTIASVTRMVLAFERGNRENFSRPSEISVGQVLERARQDQLIQEVAEYASRNVSKFKSIASQAIIGFIFYQFAAKTPKQAKTFMEGLRTGASLPEESPIRVLREKLINSPRLSKGQKVEAIIRAWNAWINDRPLKQLKILGHIPAIESN